MKGPFERLKYDLRRVYECPECHHKERAHGTVTVVLCRCQQKKKDPLDRIAMKLVEDRIIRRLPEFVPPIEVEVPEPTLAEHTTEEPKSKEGNAPETGGETSGSEQATAETAPAEVKATEDKSTAEEASE